MPLLTDNIDMNIFSKLLISFVLVFIVSGCQYLMSEKRSDDIRVETSNNEIVFIIPRMPSLSLLYVEKYNMGSKRHNKWEGVWTIDLSSLSHNASMRIEYGKVPIGVSPDRMSAVEPLETDILYSVGMDVGSTWTHGYFVFENSASGMRVNNLTYEEAKKYFVAD